MTNQSQQSSRGPTCLTAMGVLTLVMLLVMVVLGVLAWNAIGDFFGGIGDRITGLGETVGGAVGQTLEGLGETVDGIGQGVSELGESVAAIPQNLSDSVGPGIESLGQDLSELKTSVASLPQRVSDSVGETLAGLPQTISDAVEKAFRSEIRANIETKNLLAHSVVNMGTLVTASQPFDSEVKVSVSKEQRILFFDVDACGVSTDHFVEGTIEAGVDLSQVQASDFTHDIFADSWVLKLGSAKVHSCRIDYIRQTDRSRTYCGQDWDAYRILAESVALPEFLREALAERLLAKAEKEAEVVLGNFLAAVTGSDNVSIVFESEPDVEFPPSCEREPPADWKFDEESDSWVQG